MPLPIFSWFIRLLRAFLALLDALWRGARRALVLLVLLAGAWLLLRADPPALQPQTALVLDLRGPLVEQRSDEGSRALLQPLRSVGSTRETPLREVLAVLESAAADPQISHALLMLDNMGPAGLPSLREVSAALQRFKASGKPVYAWGAAYNQRHYFLAAQADAIWLHPMGSLQVQGYGRQRSYYKDLFDKLGVQVQVLRAGAYKDFGEVYSESGASPASVEASRTLYEQLWALWTGDVERARGQAPGRMMQSIDSLPASLRDSGGSLARWALQQQWVDGLKTEDELRAEMTRLGAADDKGKTFRQISLQAYHARLKPSREGQAVGVIVAQGLIVDGWAAPGRIGGQSTAALIRKAREDDQIRALVLRVNSPGGSGFGSELVRRELALTREAGKPVSVSMGDAAASGGYWISLAADEVLADAATVTGSIGVITLLPSAAPALQRAGVHTEGVHTTWLGGALDPRREPDPRVAELIQTYIDGAYADFKTLVAGARRLKPEQIEAVAQGRVWSGQDALRHGLVDRLGGLNDAVAAAAARAGLGDKPRVVYLDAERSRWQRLLGQFDWAGMSWLRGLLPQALGSADGPALPAVWSGTAEGTALLSAASSQGVGAGASLGAFGAQGALAALSGLATSEPGLDLLLLLHGSWTAAAQGSLPAVQAHCLCTVP